MNPTPGIFGTPAVLARRTESPGFPVPRLDAHDRALIEFGKLANVHPAPLVCRHCRNPLASEPQHRQCLRDGNVRLLADDDTKLRCTVKPPRLHVPAEAR